MNMYVGREDEDVKEEESGWTDYLDDFSLNRKANTSCINNSSMVSDAAWNGFNGNANPLLKRLNFKNKSSLVKEDDLEDTACSPVNSPKVIDSLFQFNFIVAKALYFNVFSSFI